MLRLKTNFSALFCFEAFVITIGHEAVDAISLVNSVQLPEFSSERIRVSCL